MMYTFVLVLHVLICVLLGITILIQRGRGGGLVEALSGVESLFGTKTSSFLVKTTTFLAILFFLTSASLAFLSRRRGLSITQKYFKAKPLKEKELQREEPLQKGETLNQSESFLKKGLPETEPIKKTSGFKKNSGGETLPQEKNGFKTQE